MATQQTSSPGDISRRRELPQWDIAGRDVLIALAAAAPALGLVAFGGITPHGTSRVGAIAFALLAAAPLLVRRRAPVAALAAIVAVGLISPDGWLVTLPSLVAVYTIARSRGWRQTVLLSTAAAIALSLAPLLHGAHITVGSVTQRTLSVAIAAAAGLYAAARQGHVDELRIRAEELERERELLARQAVAEERLRIARELHDVVAHNISLVIVQAQALEGSSTSSPQADAALRAIAQSGRDALSEMQRMLGLLRIGAPGGADRAPQPGVKDLPELITKARVSGIEVELEVQGLPRALPAAVELCAYRIVQEALTNVRKHAAPARAWIGVRYEPRALEVEIRDNGSRASQPGGVGHGLIGMRERASLFGGTLTAGPSPSGGFAVHAVLPIEGR